MIATICKQPAAVAAQPINYGLLAGTHILTLNGEVAIEHLTPGASVITRSGMRKVAGISRILAQQFQVVHITQGVLGNGRPHIDVKVAPQQPILLRDWRAKALFDTEAALVAAERLIDGSFIRSEVLAEACLYSLQFEQPEIIYVGALEMSCPAISPSTA